MVVNKSELNKLVELELAKKQYRPKTIMAYRYCLGQLASYFADTLPSEITENQIRDYFLYLINRKRSSAQGIHQAWHAFNWFYNDYLQKGYDLESISTPRKTRTVPEILTQSEIITILNNIGNIKAKAALSLIYSAGLDLGDVVNLKVTDVDFTNKRLKVKVSRKRNTRNAILSDHISELLREYLDKYKPTKWLFEGRQKASPYSKDAIQKAFRRALKFAGITKNVSVRTLKYSYAKHLEQQGVPLVATLRELDILTGQTLLFFSQIEAENSIVTFSPLDRIIDEIEKVDISSLRRILLKVQFDDEKDFLQEAITCIDAGAYRAGIVFTWNAAIRNIQLKLLRHSLSSVNIAIKKYDPKAKDVKSIDDFAYIKDSVTLEACQELGIFDKNEKGVLIECLNLRNKCGHPGKYKPLNLKVIAFIEDLTTIVFSKL